MSITNALPILILAGAVLVGSARPQTSTAKGQATPAKPKTAQAAATSGTAQTGAAQKKTVTAARKRKNASTLTTKKARISYAIGMNIAATLRNQKFEMDPEIVSQGLRDSLSGRKTKMTEPEADALLTALQDEIKAQRKAIQEADAAEANQANSESNKKEGEAFLAANKTKDGVVTLPSGLQYKILKQGDGPKPTVADTITCNYRGTLINGTEFDSSYKRGQPLTFPLKGVIRGWTEALQLMPVGSQWQLFIPSDLAYGPRGAGALIGPNSTLIFEIELISIQNKETPQDKN